MHGARYGGRTWRSSPWDSDAGSVTHQDPVPEDKDCGPVYCVQKGQRFRTVWSYCSVHRIHIWHHYTYSVTVIIVLRRLFNNCSERKSPKDRIWTTLACTRVSVCVCVCTFKHLFLFLCVWTFSCMCLCTTCMQCLKSPVEGTVSPGVKWSTMLVLGIKPGSSRRGVVALNCWVIFPVPGVYIFYFEESFFFESYVA